MGGADAACGHAWCWHGLRGQSARRRLSHASKPRRLSLEESREQEELVQLRRASKGAAPCQSSPAVRGPLAAPCH